MAEYGGKADSAPRITRSRLYDYLEPNRCDQRETTGGLVSRNIASPERATTGTDAPEAAERRLREFAALLGRFRRTSVLVPVDEDDAPLTADYGGVRWIHAFSNETALARFALARSEAGREWSYQRWLGARLLDAGVPAVGVPCGVALDVASEGDGALFPPVLGIVPDAVAVDGGVLPEDAA
ncbi:hypothetical protein ACGFX8_13375 [Streptomyces sp. NPDC048362]|uniref:hypothetical protein n=1 Tax=Streptomyces sp. NPDC048362 TaxID=3365539 RepID=UPI0037137643